MIAIMVLPFLFYFYTIVPQDVKIWKTKFYTFDSGYFETIDLYFWTLSIKFLTIGLLSIWFVSCIQKWKFVLVFPIVLEFYKLFVNINYAEKGNEDINFINTLYISIPFLLILVIISYKLNYISNKNKVNKLINEEINNQLIIVSEFKLKDYKLIKKEFDLIKKANKMLSKKEYLARLITLRDQLSV